MLFLRLSFHSEKVDVSFHPAIRQILSHTGEELSRVATPIVLYVLLSAK
jgi:hypothetical protein